jgi:cobalt-zinc-cadmium efflux system outer membrane protein
MRPLDRAGSFGNFFLHIRAARTMKPILSDAATEDGGRASISSQEARPMRKLLVLPVLALAALIAVDPPALADSPASATAPGTNIPLPRPRPAAGDLPVRRAQAGPSDMPIANPPGTSLPAALNAIEGSGMSISLQAALYGALGGNPDLVALRNSSIASPESVEVARRFPTTLNPTLWLDIRPWTWEATGHGYHPEQAIFYISWRQPIELGHQTTHRYAIAKAAYSQQQWTVVQSEMLALVQTYRFFQTAAYRREKLRVAKDLATFNTRLVEALKRRLEANQVMAADVVLSEVEDVATRQLVEVARQDYANALTDLQNQIGTPETAGTAEPLGEFVLPGNIPSVNAQELIKLALQSRPEIYVARAQAAGACAAVRLARGDRIPTPVIGPQYEKDETGAQFLGFVAIVPLPVVNNGTPLVRQREADYRRALMVLQQVEQRTTTQVKAAAAKWNTANRLVNQTVGLTDSLKPQVDRMERLFDANQADLTKLLQARQRLIQLENAELDALWQATQAQADLLTALGAPTLIAALHGSQPAPPTPTPTAATAPKPAPARARR